MMEGNPTEIGLAAAVARLANTLDLVESELMERTEECERLRLEVAMLHEQMQAEGTLEELASRTGPE